MARPRVSNPSAATLRKRRQVERRQAEGRIFLNLMPSPETSDLLAQLAELTCGTVKGESEMILRRAAKAAIAEARVLAAKLGPLYRQAEAYFPYRNYLEVPGATIRVGDRTLEASKWKEISTELGSFFEWARRAGWTTKRAKRFLERSAKAAPAGEAKPAAAVDAAGR